jgi:hypothetical protein
LHKSQREREREAKVGVGEAPARQRLDPAEPIGDGVPMDAQRRGGLGQTRVVEDRAERGQVLATDVGPRAEERSQERPRLTRPVRQVVQVAQESIGGEPVRPGDTRRVVEVLRGLERLASLGFGMNVAWSPCCWAIAFSANLNVIALSAVLSASAYSKSISCWPAATSWWAASTLIPNASRASTMSWRTSCARSVE